MKPSSYYYIVIRKAGDEPMGCAAQDAKDIRAALGDVALCAPTTLAALIRAGWSEENLWRPDGKTGTDIS